MASTNAHTREKIVNLQSVLMNKFTHVYTSWHEQGQKFTKVLNLSWVEMDIVH